MKRLTSKLKGIAGNGTIYNVLKEEKNDNETTIYLDNGYKYTLSNTDYQWLLNESSNVKPKNGFAPGLPYIEDLKSVSFVQPIED